MKWFWEISTFSGIGVLIQFYFLLIIGWVGFRYWHKTTALAISLEASKLKLYGQDVNPFNFEQMFDQVIVDENSLSRFVHYGHSMSDHPENNEYLSSLDQAKDNYPISLLKMEVKN